MRRRRSRTEGAVIAEAVVVLPVILLLVFGLMQLSAYFGDSLHLNYAAYQASRQSFLDTSANAEPTRIAISRILTGARLKGIRMSTAESSDVPGPQVLPWREYQDRGVTYRVLEVQYRSPTYLPLVFRDSQGREIFPREGLDLSARGYCPAMEQEL